MMMMCWLSMTMVVGVASRGGFSVVLPLHGARPEHLEHLGSSLGEHLNVDDVEEFFVVSPSCVALMPREQYFSFVPAAKYRAVCDEEVICGRSQCFNHRPHGWHLKQLVRLGLGATIRSEHLLFLDAETLAVGEISAKTLLQDGASRLLSKNCKVHDPKWLSTWEYWRTEYRTALRLLKNNASFATSDFHAPPKACISTTSPVVANTAVLRSITTFLDGDVRWYDRLLEADRFTDMTLYNAYRLLQWDEHLHVADDKTRILDLWGPPRDKKDHPMLPHQHATYVVDKWRAKGVLKDAMFLTCQQRKTQLKNEECFQLSRIIAEAKGGEKLPEATMYKDLRAMAFPTEASCPGKLGIALNTGDATHALNRVRYTLSEQGWIGDGSARQDPDASPPPVVVYSSVTEGCIPIAGDENYCAPVKPCCGGKNLGSTLADAQYMREHTWKRMLADFPDDTYWFLSTEDDVWWDMDRLCDITAEVLTDLVVDRETPVLIGGGAPTQSAVFGGLILMNRPLLELFANETLLDMCRDDLLAMDNHKFKEYTYPGTRYNNDHFISHCAFDFFPKHAAVSRKIFFPLFHPRAPRPEYFFHNGDTWPNSLRAPDFVKLLHDDEPIVAFHHATIKDMAFLQDKLRTERRRLLL